LPLPFEEEETIEEFHEPYLIQIGMLERTPRGRVLTGQGLETFRLTLQRNKKNCYDLLLSSIRVGFSVETTKEMSMTFFMFVIVGTPASRLRAYSIGSKPMGVAEGELVRVQLWSVFFGAIVWILAFMSVVWAFRHVSISITEALMPLSFKSPRGELFHYFETRYLSGPRLLVIKKEPATWCSQALHFPS